MLASGSADKPERTRLAMFLNFVGDEALKVYNTFTYDAQGQESKLDIVIDKFKEYCTPRKNVVYERFLLLLLHLSDHRVQIFRAVHHRLVYNRLRAHRKTERTGRYVNRHWSDTADHHRQRIATERVTQKSCQFTIAVRDVLFRP